MEGVEILDALVGGELVESGGSMLSKVYNLNSDVTSYTIEQWAELHERAQKAQWFIDNFEEIKVKFETVINGQVKFREFQSWLYEKGFKGASKIKEAEVKALLAENDHVEAGLQQDYELQKGKEVATERTLDFKRGVDATVGKSIAAYKAQIDSEIAALENNPEYEAAIEEWKKSKSNVLAWASAALKGGAHGLQHPKFAGGQQAVLGGSSGSGWTWGNQKQPDTVEFKMSGNVARSVNNAASNFGRGLSKIGRFFGIGR